MNRILLDRSIFHNEETIDKLKSCGIINACNNRNIIIYGNPILIEETTNLWFKKRKEKGKKHLRFIFEVSNGRWFRAADEIIRLELGGHQLGRQYYFFKTEEKDNLKQQFSDTILPDKLDHSLEKEIEEAKQQEHENSIGFKKTCQHYKEYYYNFYKNKGQTPPKKIYFADFCQTFITFTGEELIKKKVTLLQEKSKIIDNWKNNKNKYPFFTFWVKGILYAVYHAINRPNAKIDPNAQPDIEQLDFLQWVDIIVSDDTKFMKYAFDEFYNTTKIFYSSSEFAEYINNSNH
jgi:hypothetical protein